MTTALEVPQHIALGLSKFQNDQDAVAEVRNMFPEQWTPLYDFDPAQVTARLYEAGIDFNTPADFPITMTILEQMSIYDMDVSKVPARIRRSKGELIKVVMPS